MRTIGRPGSSRKSLAVVECDTALATRRIDAQDWLMIWARCGCAHDGLPLVAWRHPPDDGGVASLPESELAAMTNIVDPGPRSVTADE